MFVLPLLGFITVFLNLRLTHYAEGTSKRYIFFISSIIWATFAVLSLEFLSLFNAITYENLTIAWTIFLILNIPRLYISFKQIPSIFKAIKPKLEIKEIILLLIITGIIITIAVIAFIAPPNNWDSMTYHMSRVAHWHQNQTLAHYPTGIERQIVMAPGAELYILHFQTLMNGSDRMANLIQWFSMFGSILCVSAMAKLLGANRFIQIITAALATAVPMGILQGSSTQNDYVLCYFLCIVTFLIFDALLNKTSRRRDWMIGLALALAISTKGTSYVYGFFPMAFYFLMRLNKERLNIIKPLIIVIGCIFIINSGHFARNIQAYGSPISTGDHKLTNEIKNLRVLASNVIRNMSLHFNIPNDLLRKKVEQGIIDLHNNVIGLDVNDPRTSGQPYAVPDLSSHEDMAGNPLHLLLLWLSIIGLLIFRNKKDKNAWIYFLIITLSFLFFCFLLKFKIFHSRHHLSLFILLVPFISYVISKIKNQWIIFALIFCMLGSSMPWVLKNASRRLISSKFTIFDKPRIEQYFTNKLGRFGQYTPAVDYIISTGCTNIGLGLSGDDWEYPLWALFKEKNYDVRIEFINIRNPSAKLDYPLGVFEPCAVIGITNDRTRDYLREKYPSFTLSRKFKKIEVYNDGANQSTRRDNVKYLFNTLTQSASKEAALLKKNDIKNVVGLYYKLLDIVYVINASNYPPFDQEFKAQLNSKLKAGTEMKMYGLMKGEQEKFVMGQKLTSYFFNWLSSRIPR